MLPERRNVERKESQLVVIGFKDLSYLLTSHALPDIDLPVPARYHITAHAMSRHTAAPAATAAHPPARLLSCAPLRTATSRPRSATVRLARAAACATSSPHRHLVHGLLPCGSPRARAARARRRPSPVATAGAPAAARETSAAPANHRCELSSGLWYYHSRVSIEVGGQRRAGGGVPSRGARML